MNSLLMTSQIVCYGLSIVSASVNIARFVRHRRRTKRRVRADRSGAAGAAGDLVRWLPLWQPLGPAPPARLCGTSCAASAGCADTVRARS